jgi:hypothetical protein
MLALLFVFCFALNEIQASTINPDFAKMEEKPNNEFPEMIAAGQASYHVTRYNTLLLFGIAATVLWIVKGILIDLVVVLNKCYEISLHRSSLNISSFQFYLM